MPSELEAALARHRAALLAQERAAASEMVRAYGSIYRRIQDEASAIQAALGEEGLNLAQVQSDVRLRSLRAQVEVELRRFAPTAAGNAQALQAQAAEQAAANALEAMRWAGAARTTFDRLPTAAIQNLVGFASDGSPLRDLFDDIAPGTADAATDALAEGLALGQSPRVTAGRVRSALGVGLTRALTIARTECLPGDTLVDGAVIEAIYRRWYEGAMVEVVTERGRQFSATPNHPMLTSRGWVAAGELKPGDDLISNAREQDTGALRDKDVQRRPATLREIFDSLSAEGIAERRIGGKPDFHGDGMQGEIDVLCPFWPLKFGRFAPLYKPLVQQFLTPSDPTRTTFCHRCGRLLSFDQQPCRCVGTDGRASLLEPASDGSVTDAIVTGNGGLRLTRQIAGRHLPNVHIGAESLVARGFGSRLAPVLLGSPLGPCLSDVLADYGVMGTETGGDLTLRQAGAVQLDHVISVSLRPWRGHVYNLSTPFGYFTIDTLYTGNTLRAYREATHQTYERNADIVEGWVWVCRCSRRSCGACFAMHGSFHLLSERLQSHPNCTCTMAPKIRGRASRITPMGADRFAALSEADQVFVLGPGMYEAWQAGDVALVPAGPRSIVAVRVSPRWGMTRTVRPLRHFR